MFHYGRKSKKSRDEVKIGSFEDNTKTQEKFTHNTYLHIRLEQVNYITKKLCTQKRKKARKSVDRTDIIFLHPYFLTLKIKVFLFRIPLYERKTE